ncbi:hypothetical protein Pla175_31190 [Pirellulimonas nuda]|uniref:Uncharacterized protein n=1 Tax=Pirellulimonas nuda TaxID=2528009 RepID=A0A518DE11_9BACT|nr:hypothetical protein Pla175_31190 [Pirellulimonas nuda]
MAAADQATIAHGATAARICQIFCHRFAASHISRYYGATIVAGRVEPMLDKPDAMLMDTI